MATIQGTLPQQDEPTNPANQPAPDIDPRKGIEKIKSNLILTPSQVDRMTQRALGRIDELAEQMGLYLDGTGGVYANSWMGKRAVNQMQYDNEWEWRLALGGIFLYSNFSINIAKRYARLMSAKSKDDLIGTDPFFAMMPEALADDQDAAIAKSAEKFYQLKIRQSNVIAALSEGLKTALIRNEATMKITYVASSTKFRGPARVAVGPYVYTGPQGDVTAANGEPVITPAGNYIYENDDFIPDPDVEGQFRLKKEPSVVLRYTPVFANIPMLDQTLTRYQGVDLRVCDFRDFLCPLNMANIHEADINVHLFDDEWENLIRTYGMFESATNYVNQPYLSGEKSANTAKGEVQLFGGTQASSKVLKIVNCADCYMRADVDDDGIEEEVWVIIDRRARKAIWYDYLGAHIKKRPFEVIPGVERVPNRWYGTGVFEMLEHKQMYIDTQFNRVNFKSSKNSSVRFRNVNAVAQWAAGQELTFGDDTIWDINDPRFTAQNPPLFSVPLTEVDEFGMKLIELMLQASSTEVGIVGPDDGNMAGLDTTKLATGIKSLERTGNVLMKETEQEQGKAVTATLDQVGDCILENMDPNEVLYDEETKSLVTLSREEIRALGKHTRLLLTRSRSTETIETARMVVQLCREYYEALNPEEQMLLRPEYVQQLRALQVQDADKLLRVVTQEEVDAWKKAQQEAAQLPPRTSIATKFPDLERSEQEQVLKREGIEPAPIQEGMVLTDANAKEVAKQAAIAKAKEEVKPDQGALMEQKLEFGRQDHEQKMVHGEQEHAQKMTHTIESAHAKAAADKIAPSTNGQNKGKK